MVKSLLQSCCLYLSLYKLIPIRVLCTLKKQVIYPAIEQGLVAMLYPDKPKHPKQKYYLTEKGRTVLKALG